MRKILFLARGDTTAEIKCRLSIKLHERMKMGLATRYCVNVLCIYYNILFTVMVLFYTHRMLMYAEPKWWDRGRTVLVMIKENLHNHHKNLLFIRRGVSQIERVVLDHNLPHWSSVVGRWGTRGWFFGQHVPARLAWAFFLCFFICNIT